MPGFINCAGIDSPGIAGSPAIALEVVRLLGEAGLDAPADPAFNPSRAAVVGWAPSVDLRSRPVRGWRG